MCWHVRALCHRVGVFKDFVVGRFQSGGAIQAVLARQSCGCRLARIQNTGLSAEFRLIPASAHGIGNGLWYEGRAIETGGEARDANVCIEALGICDGTVGASDAQ